jgi:hypothetical protein
MASRKIPSTAEQARLRAEFAYDPATGAITRHSTGAATGWVSQFGYRIVGLYVGPGKKTKKFGAHCLAWFLQTGAWPPVHLDVEHNNRNRSDNRFANLAIKTRSENLRNSTKRRGCAVPIKGVHIHKDGRYRAQISRGNKTCHLGLFQTPEAAHAAYIEAGGRP